MGRYLWIPGVVNTHLCCISSHNAAQSDTREWAVSTSDYVCLAQKSAHAMPAAPPSISRKLLVKELRSLPHRVSLGLSGGGCGGGGVAKIGRFFGYPPSGAGKNPLPKGLVLGQISALLGKWLFRRPKEKQASSDAADAGLGMSADAADAGRIVATLSGRVG